MKQRGPFKLLRRIADGESGVVWEAVKEGTGSSLLFKALREEPTGEWLECVERLRAIESPHLRVPHEIGQDEEGHFLVADWLEGPSLEEKRAAQSSKTIPVRQALVWLRQTLWALEVLHRETLLHGDVKPSNLLLDGEENVVLTDLLTVQPLNTKHANTTATQEYLIPDSTKHNTVQRDLYAAALTFGSLVTGTIPPPPGDEPYRLSLVDPLIPEAADSLILAVQGFEPPFQSVEEMIEKVESLLVRRETVPVYSGTSPPTRVVKIPHKKQRTNWLALILAVLCFPLGYGAATLFKKPPVGAPLGLAERTGIDLREGAYEGEPVWQTTILGRPVAGFAAPDPVAGGESARARAHWVAAVLREAHFQARPLEFEFRKETEDTSDVWLVGNDRADKFLFRVTEAERNLFHTPAPALARLWTQLMKDTFTLLGARYSPGESAGVLLLLPWRNRATTLAGGRDSKENQRVKLLMEAFQSLKPEQQEDILSSYIPEAEKKEQP